MSVEDSKIIDLYWDRNETAIQYTSEKYGHYCNTIAFNILKSNEDVEECLNDTWMKTWNSIPDERPSIFKGFLGAITRNLAIDRYRRMHAKMRGDGEIELIFDEMVECVCKDTPEKKLEHKELSNAINQFLEKTKAEYRVIFVRRYFYMESIKDISKKYGITESRVKSVLFRVRKELKKHLVKEGFIYG